MASKPKPAAEAQDDAPEGEGEAQAVKKRFALPSMKVLIIAGAALLVVVGGGGAYFAFFKSPAEAKAVPEKPKPLAFVDLPEVLVNLSSAGSDRA